MPWLHATIAISDTDKGVGFVLLISLISIECLTFNLIPYVFIRFVELLSTGLVRC